ncbi:MAG: Tim44/TimA family putative adaptor protein [Rhodospirillales bacterium]
MGDSIPYIDIIFFVMIAAFLVLRLRSVLGRRDGHEGRPRDLFKGRESLENDVAGDQSDDNVVPLSDLTGDDDDADVLSTDSEADDFLAAGIRRVKDADPGFNTKEFLSGAKAAFEIILGFYASGKVDSLKPLLNADVFDNFTQAIKDREQSGQTLDDTLIRIKSADIVEAFIEDRTALITVKFISEQINTLRDQNEAVIEGDPNTINEVTDFWTFSHDPSSRNPNWILVATRSLD